MFCCLLEIVFCHVRQLAVIKTLRVVLPKLAACGWWRLWGRKQWQRPFLHPTGVLSDRRSSWVLHFSHIPSSQRLLFASRTVPCQCQATFPLHGHSSRSELSQGSQCSTLKSASRDGVESLVYVWTINQPLKKKPQKTEMGVAEELTIVSCSVKAVSHCRQFISHSLTLNCMF